MWSLRRVGEHRRAPKEPAHPARRPAIAALANVDGAMSGKQSTRRHEQCSLYRRTGKANSGTDLMTGQKAKLLFSRNPNPRLAVAVARYLEADVEFAFASPFAPGQAERYRPLNPNLSIP